jgi:hypothetical protein
MSVGLSCLDEESCSFIIYYHGSWHVGYLRKVDRFAISLFIVVDEDR